MKHIRCRVAFAVATIAIMVATLAALGGPFFASPALAAGEPASLKDVVVSVYPEYDDPLGLGSPTVLVMLDGQIDGAVPPTTIRFLVPKEALMYSAGSGPRQQYVGGPPNRVASDIQGWDEISYELKTGYFVVEYYVPIQASPNKAFSVPIIVPYPIDGLTAIVQEPRKATGFSVVPQTQPANQQQYTDAQGFNITSYTYDALDGSQELSFSVSYTKTDPTPSLEIRGKGSSPVGLIVAVALAGVLVFGLVTYGVRRKSASSRHNKHNISARPQAKKVAGANFCPKCGAKLENSQKFCHQCGTRLRERQSKN